MFNNAVSADMASFWATQYLRSLAMMAAYVSEVPVLAMISAGEEDLSPPTVRRVWILATVASSFSAVTCFSKISTYVMKADSCSMVVREALVRLLVQPYGFSPTSLFWKARRSAQSFVKYCTVRDHDWSAAPWFSHDTSSITVDWELEYMFSTKITTF